MIKEIILDYGNVISHFTNDHLIEKISALVGKKKEEISDLIYKDSDITKRFESGKINSNQFYEELSNLCGLNVTYDKLKEIYSKDKFTPVKGMNKLIESLRGKYKIGLLSNTGEWDYNYLLEVTPIVNTFDFITTSFEVGAMKPSSKIFEDALKKSQLKPQECVYADDVIDYVEAAKNMGIQAVHFTTTENFRIDLKSLGVEI